MGNLIAIDDIGGRANPIEDLGSRASWMTEVEDPFISYNTASSSRHKDTALWFIQVWGEKT